MKDPKEKVPQISLKDSRAFVYRNLEKGTTCPCCDRPVKLYDRPIREGLAKVLIWMTKKWLESGEWVDVHGEAPREYIKNFRDFTILRHWGLIVKKESDDSKKKNSGLWRPTELGIQFHRNEISVPKIAILYNNKPVDFSEEKIKISDTFGEYFDYEAIMKESVYREDD